MSQKIINFAIGFHNHQPVGNFKSVFEENYNKAYLPLLKVMEKHPGVKAAFHYTGPLWDYFLKNKPEWIEKIRSLVKSGRVEMLSGGYYEPILPNISDRDKIAQIKKMNRVIRRETNCKPSGMWCAERVWEPSLAKPIALSDIQYTILDESHFHAAGLREEEIFGYYVTEEQGHAICIFPISYTLRYMIPQEEPEDVIKWLTDRADESGKRLVVFADDGEKFGSWPGSQKKVWQEGWMDKFFDLLEKNTSIKLVTFEEYMANNPPLGRIYLPTSSYFEMTHWALPTKAAVAFGKIVNEMKAGQLWEKAQSFIHGGFWRNFLVKYPESNRLQKKALYVSEKVQKMMGKYKADAEEELFRSQCNCAYWHGVFGGIYLPHLRNELHKCLIKAECFADEEFHKGEPYQEVICIDIDRDTFDEVIINTRFIQLAFSTALGGALYDLIYKPLAVNLGNTLTRREEWYHSKLKHAHKKTNDQEAPSTIDSGIKTKEDGLDNYLIYDSYQRLSFIDHFLPKEASVDTFKTCSYKEIGDFIEKPYEVFTSSKDDKAVVTLSKKGHISEFGQNYPVEIEKTFFTPEEGRGFQVQYWIVNNSDADLELNYGCEMNFAFISSDPAINYMETEEIIDLDEVPTRTVTHIPLTEAGVLKDRETLTLTDGLRGCQVTLTFGQKADVWYFPIETVSMSEDGFEKVYQSTVIMPVWNITIESGDNWDNTMEVQILECR